MHKLRRPALTLLLIGVVFACGGCTRAFFRKRADKEVDALLREKDQFPDWHLEQYHVDPDPRARFASSGRPDRPPMPPDDPAAAALSPNPQRPGRAGVGVMEGDGFMRALVEWDAENRAALGGTAKENPKTPTPSTSPYRDPLGSESSTGFLLNLDQANELTLFNSREFQDRREDLYLTALPVTVERFAFSSQFFAGEQLIRERLGKEYPGGPANRWVGNSTFGFTKLFSTGALLLFQFANRTVFEFANKSVPHTISESSLNLDFMQPLLRGGGHAVTLEPLTQSERNLLYELRDFARFRKQFYVAIAAGADIGGINVGTTRFRNRAATFGFLDFLPGADVRPGRGNLLNLAATGLAQASGYLPVVLNQSLLENEKQNIAALSDILKLFEGFKEGGELAQLQVDRVEQQLLQSRSNAYQRDQALRDTIDRFKLQLGVPTDLPLELDNGPVLSQKKLLYSLEVIIKEFDEVRNEARELYRIDDPIALRRRLQQLGDTSKLVQGTMFRSVFLKRWSTWAQRTPEESSREQKKLRADLRVLLKERDEAKEKQVPIFQRRIDEASFDLAVGVFEESLREHEAVPIAHAASALGTPAGAVGFGPLTVLPVLLPKSQEVRGIQAATFRQLYNNFEGLLIDARNERIVLARSGWQPLPRLCIDGVDLMTGSLDVAESIVARTALSNRFDLMNVRGQVVDAWRQIAVAANSLLGTFNIEYHLNSLSPTSEAMPFAFSGSRTRHQLVLSGELPLVRILERNNYRASLIGFQRQRRTLTATEDTIVAGVRAQLRQLRVIAENYKIAQRAVELAYLQVENALDTFRAPPIPTTQALGSGTSSGNAAGNNAALTQQLLEAQNNLVRAQNSLVTLWVQFITTRMQLYRDLELLPLDQRGVWTDDVEACRCPSPSSPGPVGPSGADPAPAPAPRPLPPGETVPDDLPGDRGGLGGGSGPRPAGNEERP